MREYPNESAAAEEQRVLRFMQAIERMHNDPAEAARIDLIIDDVDGLVTDEGGQQAVVDVHSEGNLNVPNVSLVGVSPARPKPEKTETATVNKLLHVTVSRSALLGLGAVVVLLIAGFGSWPTAAAVAPMITLLMMELGGTSFCRWTGTGSSSVTSQSSGQEVNRR
ncbi:hypothetical protein ACFXPM_31840 [Streptomyces sp. NPDC059095]|uniref:hypothetical protein n=1 Tax=Streptomyces sp. NPDC059095 TaxID=3346726 RepID=UPI0036974332